MKPKMTKTQKANFLNEKIDTKLKSQNADFQDLKVPQKCQIRKAHYFFQ